MVQDTSLSNEIYLAGPTCGGWGLPSNVTSSDNIDHANLRECAIFWAVTIPGETKWCSGVADQISNLSTSCRTFHPHKFPVPDAAHIGIQVKASNYHRSFKCPRFLIRKSSRYIIYATHNLSGPLISSPLSGYWPLNRACFPSLLFIFHAQLIL